jgi:UDP-N-acetylmuramate dehydrogenase
MTNDILFKQLPPSATVVQRARLSSYTTFQLGGSCPALIHCPDAQTLTETVRMLHRHSVEFLVIGQGSNLLVADAGIDQVVLRFCTEEDAKVETHASRMVAPGHLLLDNLARIATERGIGNLAFCSGIPGTLGGAIAGNAGAFGKQIGDVVESVKLLNKAGEIHETPRSELGFGYRTSRLKQTGEVVLEATLNLPPADFQALEKEREEIMQLRRTKHPDWHTMPCAGSVFRNVEPTSAAGRRQAAGWFLEQAGAKNLQVGQAHLFEKHANIIIADPGATAREVFLLTEKMIAAVEQKFGFKLEREIKLLGSFR